MCWLLAVCWCMSWYTILHLSLLANKNELLQWNFLHHGINVSLRFELKMEADLKSTILTEFSSVQALLAPERPRTVNITYSKHSTPQKTRGRKQTPVTKALMYSLLTLTETVYWSTYEECGEQRESLSTQPVNKVWPAWRCLCCILP